MAGLWVLLCQISWLSFTVGYPGCCEVTQSNNDIDVVCANCGLKGVPNRLPGNTTSLDLSHNDIGELSDRAFRHLQKLKSLSLDSNYLRIIHGDAFFGLTQLLFLSLANNVLSGTIDNSAFCPLSNLTELDLKSNQFHSVKTYPSKALSCLRNLQSLGIDLFEGFYFESEFLQLKSLSHIEFFAREKLSIKNSSFLGLSESPITHLKLGDEVKEMEINSLSPFKQLQYLSINGVHRIGISGVLAGLHGLRHRSMASIDIGRNIDHYSTTVILTEDDFTCLKTICVQEIYLDRNGIEAVTMGAILSWTSRSCLKVLDISNNNFITGQLFTLLTLFPELTHLQASNEQIMSWRPRRQVHRTTTVFFPRKLQYINVSHNSLTGELQSLTFANSDELRVVDVSFPVRFSWTDALLNGLEHVSELYMSGIDCSRANPSMFSSMKRLTILKSRYSYFGRFLANDSIVLFRGLYSLSSVDLSGNNVTNIEKATFTDQIISLKTLILSDNSIERLPSQMIGNMLVLETADFRHNSISKLTESDCNTMEDMKRRSKNFLLDLSDNPLLCICDNMAFLTWAQSTNVLSNKASLTCLTAGGDVLAISDFLKDLDSFREHCEARFWLMISVVLFTTLLAVGVVAYCYRRHCYTAVWRGKVRHCEFELFVGYSHHNSGWFKQNLVPVMEKEKIIFCCYDLNFEAGKSIVDNIWDSIASARRMLFLVSYEFLHSDWGLYELGIASKDVFRSEKQENIIIIFLDDIKRCEMPKVLRRIWDRIVCLKWPCETDTYDEYILKTAREKFWKKFTKSLKKKERCREVEITETDV